jgi:hypothetical protein
VPVNPDDQIGRLAEKLSALRKRDVSWTVFGANLHRYKCKPVSQAALTNFEVEVGIELPADYRRWMFAVGWGAGPEYGLWPPHRVIEELCHNNAARGMGGDVAAPLTITEKEIELYRERVREAKTLNGISVTADSFRGALPISHQGCNGYSYLVASGQFRGCMFGECCDLIHDPPTPAAAFWPIGIGLNSPRNMPFSFLEWMDNWLDAGLRQVL